MSDYEAAVYDLDGTLVELDVDWDEVRREAAVALDARGVDVEGADLWEMLDISEEAGYRRVVEEILADHERAGARRSRRLALADDLPLTVPTGVCSLNAESACRIALEVHGLDGHVSAVVGRDSLDVAKPDPRPLLAVVDALGVDPRRTLFVGDSQRDATTADRAGVDFQWVRERVQ